MGEPYWQAMVPLRELALLGVLLVKISQLVGRERYRFWFVQGAQKWENQGSKFRPSARISNGYCKHQQRILHTGPADTTGISLRPCGVQ